MPQQGTVTVRGLRETLVALNRIERGAHKRVFGELMQAAAGPVRQAWVSKLYRYPQASTSTITPKMTTRAIFVTQRAKKVTGKRGDFGAIEMRRGLEALFEEADNTTKAVEEGLDDLTREAGF